MPEEKNYKTDNLEKTSFSDQFQGLELIDTVPVKADLNFNIVVQKCIPPSKFFVLNVGCLQNTTPFELQHPSKV